MALVAPLPTKPGRSSFTNPDAEGAPDSHGVRRHAALDWFAKAGTPVVAPEAGRIVEVTPSKGNSGQVFGGVVKLQNAAGQVWVFRHVDPIGLRVGQRVGPGTPIARVTWWQTNPSKSHSHIEVWRTLRGGYNFGNMLDPGLFFAAGGGSSYPSRIAGAIGDAAGDAIGGIPGAGPILGAGIDAAGGIGGAADIVTAPARAVVWVFENWDRVLEVIGGGIILLLGLYRLAGQLGAPSIAAAIPAGRLAKAAA